MNLTGIIFGLLLTVLYVYTFKETWKARRALNSPDEKYVRSAVTFALFVLILLPIILVVSILNFYGIGRIPVFNEMRSSIPQSYNPPDKPVKPPVAGSTQPSSQPAFDEHKAQMEKLKRDGF